MNPLDVLSHLTALYVEDDGPTREHTAEVLRGFFHTLLLAEDGHQGLKLFKTTGPNPVRLVIADIKMPQMNGLELATEIRKIDRKVPIFITSSYSQCDDLLQAIRLNLVDYLTKPLSYARLKTALAACGQRIIDEGLAYVRIDDGTHFWPASRALHQQGREIALTAKETTLLELLVRHRGRWVNKERIADVVWGDGEGMSDPALKNLIFKLRNKIGRFSIINSYSQGYSLRVADGS